MGMTGRRGDPSRRPPPPGYAAGGYVKGIIVMPHGPVPSWEDQVRADYIEGRIDVDQLEAELGLIMGGGLPQRLFGGFSPFEAPAMERGAR